MLVGRNSLPIVVHDSLELDFETAAFVAAFDVETAAFDVATVKTHSVVVCLKDFEFVEVFLARLPL